MSSDYLISLDNVADFEAAEKGGGKFLGLFKAQKLLKENMNSEIDVVIPKTFVLTTDAYKMVDMDMLGLGNLCYISVILWHLLFVQFEVRNICNPRH